MPRRSLPNTEAERRLQAQRATNTAWANCEDRTARTEAMRANSPSSVEWHAKRKGFDPENLTPAQRKQAESARKAYFQGLALKSSRTRRRRKAAREAASRKAIERDGGAA